MTFVNKLKRINRVFDHICLLEQKGSILFSYQDLKRALTNGPCIIFYLNPHTMYCETILDIDINQNIYFVYEGNSAVFFARRFHRKKSISSLNLDDSGIIFQLLSDLLDRKKKILFIGGLEKDVPRFKSKMLEFGFKISCVNGYQPERFERIIKNYEFIFLSLGSPLQEQTAQRLSSKEPSASFLTCGGFVSQFVSAKSTIYPTFVVKLKLRFLYRMLTSMAVLRRVIMEYPLVYVVWWWRVLFKGMLND